MTARTLLWVLYWTATLTVAAIASLAAAIPFTGVAGNAASLIASGGVCLIGIACAPTPGGTR